MAMMPLLPIALSWTVVLVPGLVSAFKVQMNITAGENVTLPCQASNNNEIIIAMEWSRADLPAEYVLFYRDEQFDPEYQHPSFKNRVDLQDRQMKDGDVSLILNNVTTADAGTYECRVIQKQTSRRKRAHLGVDPISSIYLHVDPPGQPGGLTEDGGKEDGSVGLIAGVVVSAVLFVAAVAVFLIYQKCKKHDRQLYQPPVEMNHV